MELKDLLSPALAGSALEPSLARLHEIYARIESEQSASLAAIDAAGPALSCPVDCGSCCEGFIPDLLTVEARYLAAWLLRERGDLAERAMAWDEGSAPRRPPCPFHEAERSGGHCGVYPGRPLVCRLFGFSAVRDRDGAPAFALCSRMPARGGRRRWKGTELEEELGAALPDMTIFGSLACAIEPEGAGDRRLLTELLPEELRRLALFLRFAAQAGRGGDEPEPEPSAPAPRAA